MIALNLQDALAARLREIFSDYALPAKSGAVKNIKVFCQYLPQPKGPTIKPRGEPEDEEPEGAYGPEDFEENFPCAVVKFDEATDKEENTSDATRIHIRVLVGVYDENPDCQGYRDVMNILETIRQELLTTRYLERKYKLEMPFKWYLFEEQPWPVFFGQIETVWETGRPLMPGTENIYGKP
ncbi:MAG: hypothetical protein LBQ42_07485 [Synergistaceae bacterium]|jgi:hypothetical protein|nr:hypothetical protein [Synergistaceae bacterium]